MRSDDTVRFFPRCRKQTRGKKLQFSTASDKTSPQLSIPCLRKLSSLNRIAMGLALDAATRGKLRTRKYSGFKICTSSSDEVSIRGHAAEAELRDTGLHPARHARRAREHFRSSGA